VVVINYNKLLGGGKKQQGKTNSASHAELAEKSINEIQLQSKREKGKI